MEGARQQLSEQTERGTEHEADGQTDRQTDRHVVVCVSDLLCVQSVCRVIQSQDSFLLSLLTVNDDLHDDHSAAAACQLLTAYSSSSSPA